VAGLDGMLALAWNARNRPTRRPEGQREAFYDCLMVIVTGAFGQPDG